MSGRAAAALLLVALPLWAAWPSWLPSSLRPHLPVWVERVLYNPRERTAEAIEATSAAGRGAPVAALAPAETALRLAPDDPLVQYDAGTAYLAAARFGDRRRAVEVLERAARTAGPELAAAAHYNLGNARLAARDPAAAAESFKQALRLEPGNADAKFNLELALRESRRQPPRLPVPGKGAGPLGGNRPSDEPGEGEGRGEQQRSGAGEGEREDEPQDDGQGQGGRGDARRSGRSPLPNFRDQPGMSAAEAADLLRAVENLERQQRRALAAKQVRQRAAEDRDW